MVNKLNLINYLFISLNTVYVHFIVEQQRWWWKWQVKQSLWNDCFFRCSASGQLPNSNENRNIGILIEIKVMLIRSFIHSGSNWSASESYTWGLSLLYWIFVNVKRTFWPFIFHSPVVSNIWGEIPADWNLQILHISIINSSLTVALFSLLISGEPLTFEHVLQKIVGGQV